MAVNLELYDRYLWHKQHMSMYVVGRAADCALALARAEMWADAEEADGLLRCDIEFDSFGDADSGEYLVALYVRDEPHGAYKVAESLGGIDSRSAADTDYFRTVRAELASQHLWYLYESEVKAVLPV